MISPSLRQSLASCPTLPSLPTAVLRVIELARDPDVRMQPLVEALNYDPALTARLIALANTVFYAQAAHPASTLREAVERLGLDMTISLALGFSLARSYGNRPRTKGLNLYRYWQRSLTSAVAARVLAQRVPGELDTDSIFTAALLQDIGTLALDAVEGPSYAELAGDANQHDEISLRERIEPGADHAEIGAWLAASWGLSQQSASDFADIIFEKLRAEPLVQHQGEPIYVTASVGAANFSDGEFVSSDEMIHKADQRMYLSKRQGRNRITAD